MADGDDTVKEQPAALTESWRDRGSFVKTLPATPDVEAAIARYRGTKVFCPWAGKTLFEHFGRFELDLRSEMPPGDLDSGVIVVSFPHSAKPGRLPQVFAELAGVWTEALRRAAAERRLRIVLDVSPESYPAVLPRLRPIHQGLAELGVPMDCAVMVTQDRGYEAGYANLLDSQGWDHGLRVLNYDYWIRRFHAQFERRGAKVHARRLATFEARSRSRGRRFLSLNMTLRPTKLLFLLSLIRDGLWDQGHISFGGLYKKASNFDAGVNLNLSEGYFSEKLDTLGGFDQLKLELMPYFAELEAKGQILLGEIERDGPNGLPKRTPMDPMLGEYDDSWFTAVTETEMRARRSRITEKPFGPLVNFHPFVIFGNPHALAQVRAFGYQTFGEAIDETYDEIEEPRPRLLAAYREFARLCAMDEDALSRMEAQLREKLLFNAEWGLTRLPRLYRDRIDLAFMDELFDVGPPLRLGA